MALISLENISHSYSGPLLLDSLQAQIEPNERICLLGRNGAGKSTLMKIIAGRISPDSGTVHKEESVRVSYFDQDIPDAPNETIYEIVAKGLGKDGELMAKYHRAEKVGDLEALSQLADELNETHGWSTNDAIEKIASQMSLDLETIYQDLSGGQKRRVLLAQALVSEPDLLLLDEPTNHFDIDSILWMESFLMKLQCSLLFVTHDRMLVRKLATRIMELDRGKVIDWSCSYDIFLERKQAVLEAEEKQWSNFDKKLKEEEAWIRRGTKARRTRNEGRVRALKKMREERKQRRVREGKAEIQIDDKTRSGTTVIKAKNIHYSYGEKPLIKDFSLYVQRGDKIGIMGPNGCGKTTLIKVLLGELPPDSGTVKLGTQLEIAYFDQLREQLDPDKTAWQTILPHGDHLQIGGRRKHIISYMKDFLFSQERAKTPVKFLSGGERNRLLLARLFTKPANFLVLDEPTNDLDEETLELLEDLIVNFSGTVLLICHDRAFLNNVVTCTLAFDGEGSVKEIVGGYDEWFEIKRQKESQKKKKQKAEEAKVKRTEEKPKQLSYNEKRELEELPSRIEQLEKEQSELHDQMADPKIYQDKDAILAAKSKLDEVERSLQEAYARWESLESNER